MRRVRQRKGLDIGGNWEVALTLRTQGAYLPLQVLLCLWHSRTL